MSIIQLIGENDALGVTKLINAQAPKAPYASYYPAMLADFVKGPSVIAKRNNDDVTGVVLGIYDWNFKKLIISHVVTTLTDMARIEQSALLQKSFKNAVAQGVEEVTAHLDMTENSEVAQAIHGAAQAQGLRSHVVFNENEACEPSEIVVPNQRAVMRALKENSDAVTYRHPTVDDAFRIWSLVNYMNREMGGLDLYAISNYERLLRDTPETVMLAEYDGEIGAFSICTATSSETGKKGFENFSGLNMWQTGSVLPGAGFNCEKLLLDELRPNYLNFTVTADNSSANKTAQRKVEHLSELHGLAMAWNNPRAIESDVLGGGHDPEVIYTVAPEPIIEKINQTLG